MVPPRLTIVSRNDNFAAPGERDEQDEPSLEARELARAIAEVESIEEGSVAITATEARGTETRIDDAAMLERLRIAEAVLFAATEPLDEETLRARMGRDAGDVTALLAALGEMYATRGINLVRVAGKWAFRTAPDLSYILERHSVEERRLSKAALETLSIIAYHQPVTRAEIEDIRGVTTSAGTLDILMEQGWIRPRGRRRAPGKPLTYGTTDSFLSHFGLDTVKDLPGLQDLKAQGLLDGHLPPGFTVPQPQDIAALMPDELPLEEGDEERDDDSAAEDTEDAAVDASLDEGLPVGSDGLKSQDDSGE